MTIGLTYQYSGDYEISLNYFIESLNMRKEIFNNVNHPDIATSFETLGYYYQEIGDYKNAFDYHLKSLNMRKELFVN